MNKKFLTILALALIVTKLSFCDPISQMYKNNPWQYIEYIFITKPENKLKQFQNRLAKFSLATTAGLAGYFASTKIVNMLFDEEDEMDRLTPLKNLKFFDCDDISQLLKYIMYNGTVLTSTVIAALTTYFTVKSVLRKHIEYKNLKHFINSLQSNRDAIPKELQESFNLIQQNLQKTPNLFDEQASEFIFNLKNKIFEKFPEKYKYSKKDFFTVKFFNLDVGGTLTGIANLIKSIFRK